MAVQREAVSCSDPAVREQLLARKREGRRAAAGEEAPWLLGCGNGGREPVRSGRAWAGAGGWELGVGGEAQHLLPTVASLAPGFQRQLELL